MATTAGGRREQGMQLSFLEMLDRTFRIYREFFVPLVLFTAAVTIPITIITTILQLAVANSVTTTMFGRASSDNVGLVCFSSLIILIGTLIQFALIYGVGSYITSERVLGRKATISEAFAAVRERIGALAWGVVFAYIVLVALVFTVLVLTGIFELFMALFGFVVYIGVAIFGLLAPVLTLESVPAGRGVNRAYALGRKRFWVVLGVLAAIYALITVITLAVSKLFDLIGQPLFTDFTTLTLWDTVVSTALGIILTPLLPIAMTLLYYDVRARTEGLDIALSALETPNPRPANVASPGGEPLLTNQDVVNVVILIVATLVLALVAGGLIMSVVQSITGGVPLPQ